MSDLHRFTDIHSHSRRGPEVVTNLALFEEPADADEWYSAGIHPWALATLDKEELERARQWVRRMAGHPRVVAIGECGFDSRHTPKAPPELQEEVFAFHRALSMEHGKPMIIHCTGCTDTLIRMARGMVPAPVVHGFRGKPELARQLLRAGFGLSYGKLYNQESFDITPADRRFRESD